MYVLLCDRAVSPIFSVPTAGCCTRMNWTRYVFLGVIEILVFEIRNSYPKEGNTRRLSCFAVLVLRLFVYNKEGTEECESVGFRCDLPEFCRLLGCYAV